MLALSQMKPSGATMLVGVLAVVRSLAIMPLVRDPVLGVAAPLITERRLATERMCSDRPTTPDLGSDLGRGRLFLLEPEPSEEGGDGNDVGGLEEGMAGSVDREPAGGFSLLASSGSDDLGGRGGGVFEDEVLESGAATVMCVCRSGILSGASWNVAGCPYRTWGELPPFASASCDEGGGGATTVGPAPIIDRSFFSVTSSTALVLSLAEDAPTIVEDVPCVRGTPSGFNRPALILGFDC